MNKIYIYDKPGSRELGLLKIGQTKEFDAEERVSKQNKNTNDYIASQREYELHRVYDAIDIDGNEFTDKYVHSVLKKHNIERGNAGTEWFRISLDDAIYVIEKIIAKEEHSIDIQRHKDFGMRDEQKAAVELTKSYFDLKKGSSKTPEFLWNAKMRFGKTFTAYQLMLASKWNRVLILTYKPAVESAWNEDLMSHKDFKGYRFFKGKEDFMTLSSCSSEDKIVCFSSYQDLIQNDREGNVKEKHVSLFNENWDCIIVDEFHYGASTSAARAIMGSPDKQNTDIDDLDDLDLESRQETIKELSDEMAMLDTINKEFKTSNKLYLSGTPFKALADSQFSSDQIFNWTYTNEQEAKKNWFDSNQHLPASSNPYYMLPEVKLYVFEPNDFLLDYANNSGHDRFNLNSFFEAKSGKFKNESSVLNWLSLIQGNKLKIEISDFGEVPEDGLTNKNYPFSNRVANDGFKHEVKHSLWYLPNIASCEAMYHTLSGHPFFCGYEIVRAYGKYLGSNRNSVEGVKKRISNSDKSITLSCGKLTTGISVKEWNAVFFLRDINSPESYFQTAFRAQTPHYDKVKNILHKEECYIFDFSPNRSLSLLSEYATKLSDKPTNRKDDVGIKEKVSELLHYLPVISITGAGGMKPLSAIDVLKMDMSGMTSSTLGSKFLSNSNFDLSDDVLDIIGLPENQERIQEILERVKKFKKFTNTDDEKKNNPSLEKLNTSQGKIKSLVKKVLKSDNVKDRKELDKEKKKRKDERDKIRELLKTLLSRIPLFMYLSHASEENINQVLNNTQSSSEDLFRKTTGITEDDFYELHKIGLIKAYNLEGYILKFKELEDNNFELFNELLKK